MELTTLIEETPDDLQPEKRVNHVEKRLKIGRELRMTMCLCQKLFPRLKETSQHNLK